MSNIFSDIFDADELQKAYREKAMKYHPDKGGDAAIFVRLKSDYDARKKQIEREREELDKRKKVMRTVGTVGAMMQKYSQGQDFSQEAMSLVPDEYKGVAGIAAQIIKNIK